MANKKITVLDDTSDDDLTPEQEHTIEVKVDKMLNPRQSEETTPPKIKKRTSKILVLDSLDDKPATAVKSAPLLEKRTAGKTKISVNRPGDDTDMPVMTTEPESSDALATELTPEELPTSPLDIGISAAEAETAPEDAGDTDAEQSDQTPEATPETETTEDEAAVKKYRPPDGPLPFKRAEPTTDSKPLEQAAADLDELDEDSKEPPSPMAKPVVGKHRPHRRGARRLIIMLILLILAAAAIVPKVRAAALSLLQVHGSLNVTVVDSKTHAPLSDVTVRDGNLSATTNQQGKVTLTGLKLGSQTVKLQKTAYADVSTPVLLTWKSMALNEVTMQVTGHIYGFVATDYVSDKPIATAQANDGTATSHADTKGLINVGVDASSKQSAVDITAPGYLPAKVTLPSSQSTAAAVTLVPSVPYVYVVRQAGLYDVYKATVDAQNKKLLLGGTGRESSDMSLLTSGGSQTAVVSTRDNQRDKAGYLLDTLTVINVSTGVATTVDHAQQIKLVGWFSDHLVYTALEANAAATDPARYKLLTFNVTTRKATELDHANTFNDVATANGAVYYALSNVASGGTSGLYKINPDGSGKQTLLTSNISSISRTDYKDLIFSGTTARYSYKPGTTTKPTVTTATESSKGRLYIDSPDGRHSAWTATSTGTLTLYNKATATESVLAKQAGLSYPLGWLSAKLLLYRVDSSGVATDYVMSLDGGTAKKVMSVVDVAGPALWQD